MEQSNTKFIEFKQKLLDLKKEESIFDKLKQDHELNRNYQFQIYLLLELEKDDYDLKNMIEELKEKNITIHIFNEYLSKEQILSLLESNDFKLNRTIKQINNTNPIDELQKKLDELKEIDEKRNLIKKYSECFEKSKKEKWLKKIRSQAITTTMFLALFTKKRNKKFKSLMQSSINNLNSNFHLNIDVDNPDKEFIKVFYEQIINWSVKKSLLITLLILVIIFFIALSTILICVL